MKNIFLRIINIKKKSKIDKYLLFYNKFYLRLKPVLNKRDFFWNILLFIEINAISNKIIKFICLFFFKFLN